MACFFNRSRNFKHAFFRRQGHNTPAHSTRSAANYQFWFHFANLLLFPNMLAVNDSCFQRHWQELRLTKRCLALSIEAFSHFWPI
jgi:hypothetical protein